MIVYSSRKPVVDAAHALAGVRALAERVACGGEHADAAELLIEYGRLESGALDAASPERDEATPLARTLREGAMATGRIFRASWRGEAVDGGTVDGLRRVLDALASAIPDGPIAYSVPEGYAYYSLYPETYLAAAERFADKARPARAVVVGVRSIGTSLSAAVAAGVEARGGEVRSFTVRPRGHPFDRAVTLGPELSAEVEAWRDAWFLVVDEGPGLSGSSFAGTAAALAELGVPDERIVFFPSWLPDGQGFASPAARERWPRHRKVLAEFDEVWAGTGRPGAGLVDGELREVSAGEWRRVFWPDARCWPGVQPQHERRKFLARAKGNGDALLLKFAGLGGFGRKALERARRLAELGFGPPAREVADGFLVYSWVPGRPLAASDADGALIDRMGDYTAALARDFRTGGTVDFDGTMEMITVNVKEGLGDDWAGRLDALHRFRGLVGGRETVAVDGRMLPHEWIRTADGLLKTDGVDHHDDHFFPGRQDAAWDLAGAIAELDLPGEAAHRLLDRYAARSGDREAVSRLPFNLVAYLAWRLGYATMSADALGDQPDAPRLRALAHGYAARLKREIGALR